jgi:hypothetical protein
MPPRQHESTESEQVDQAASDAAEDAALASAFEGTNVDRGDKPAPAKDEAADEAAKPAPDDAAASAPAPTAPADPYAGLSPEVRDRLAKLDKLEQHNRSMDGRFAAMKKELDALKASAPPPPPPPKPPKREAVRGELPEVADAIDEAVQELRDELAKDRPSAAAPPSSPQDATEPPAKSQEELDLEEVHPDWVKKLGGTDFNLWLTSQPADYAAKVRTSSKATQIAAALTRFDSDMARRSEAQKAAAATSDSRKTRVAASATASRGNARPPPGPSTEEDEEEAAFQAAATRR